MRRGGIQRHQQRHLLQDRGHGVEKKSVLLPHLLRRRQHRLWPHPALRPARHHQRAHRQSAECQAEAERHHRGEQHDPDGDDDDADHSEVDDRSDDVCATQSLHHAPDVVRYLGNVHEQQQREDEEEQEDERSRQELDPDAPESVSVRSGLGEHFVHRFSGLRGSCRNED